MKNNYEISNTKTFNCDTDTLPDSIKERYVTTKQDLLTFSKERINSLLRSISNSTYHSTAYYSQYKDQLDMFYSHLQALVLPKQLEPYWRYVFELTPTASILFLEHVREFEISVDDNQEEHITSELIDQSFFLFAIKGDVLSVDDYAKKYNVESVTVRQWIRRGKLKTAKKVGKEWYIPALTDVPMRGYEGGQYKIREQLKNLPEEYRYLNEYKLITVWQDVNDKNLFHAILSEAQGINSRTKHIDMTNSEREKFELCLMETPGIDFIGEEKRYSLK